MVKNKQRKDKDIQKLLAKQNLALAKEYLDIAKFNQKYKNSYRGVIDVAYNAAELCAKGCLALKLQRLPSTHKGVIQKFSEIYVKTNIVKREIGRKLAQSLRYRNLARYEKTIDITKEQANEVLDLTITLQNILNEQLKKLP